GVPPARPRRVGVGVRNDLARLQPVHPGPRPGHRPRLLVRAPPHAGRPLHPRGRPRSGDPRRPRRHRRPPLHRGVRDRLVPRRARRGPGHPGQDHRARHGHRDDRRGLHRRGHRRPRLVLGNVPRGPRVRPGAVVRHPVHPALLDLLGVRPHGRRPHHPAVGPHRATADVTGGEAERERGPAPAGHPRRAPWGRPPPARPVPGPALGSGFYTFLANDVVIWALFATSLNLLVGYTGLVSFGHAAYFGIGAYTTGLLMKKAGASFLLAFPAAGLVAALFALVFGFFC